VNAYWIIIPILVILVGTLALGIGLIFSALTSKYRDIGLITAFLLQIAMYATPVLYTYTYIKNESVRLSDFIEWNPLTCLFEFFRFILFNAPVTFPIHSMIASVVFPLLTLLVGVFVFKMVEENFIDTV
jgi:lipopolysaccharide transport system permease protein